MCSPNGKQSPSKYGHSSKDHSVYNPTKNTRLQLRQYFCHYSNGVYMGGSDCFKKKGEGILLLDNGACVLCSHVNDIMTGHNVMFKNGSITSIIANRSPASSGVRSKDVCFRFRQHLMQFKQNCYNQIEGAGYLLNYLYETAFQFTFHQSVLVKKIKITDRHLLETIFKENKLEKILDAKHAETLAMRFPGFRKAFYHIAHGEDHVFGYYRDKKIEGVAFRVRVTQTPKQDFNVTIGERGNFVNSKLNEYGQQHFKNGNYYIGCFHEGKFHGDGIMVSPDENKWVYGYYNSGKLIEVIDSNAANSEKKLAQGLKSMHSGIQQPYLQQFIKISPNAKIIEKLILIVQQEKLTERKPAVQNQLKKVQHDYLQSGLQGNTQKTISQLLERQNKKSRSKSKSKSKNIGPPSKQKSKFGAENYIGRNRSQSNGRLRQLKYIQNPEFSSAINQKEGKLFTRSPYPSAMRSSHYQQSGRKDTGAHNLVRSQSTTKCLFPQREQEEYENIMAKITSNDKLTGISGQQRGEQYNLSNWLQTPERQHTFRQKLHTSSYSELPFRPRSQIGSQLSRIDRISQQKRTSESKQKERMIYRRRFKYLDEQNEKDEQPIHERGDRNGSRNF